MANEYKQVPRTDFFEYIDDISKRLKKDAPEWEIHTQSTSTPKEAVYYHLTRVDFSKGKDQTWDIPINTWVFGYVETLNNVENYYLLNIHPLEHTE